ncbi:MAG: hypothetical protein ABI882_13685 [Acidobacteriota bacterium]
MNGSAQEQIIEMPSAELRERTPEDLRQEIEVKKEAIAETLNRLDQRVERAVDWRAQVGDHPFVALGLAASLGCLFAGIFKRNPTPGERIRDALAEGVEDIAAQVRDHIGAQFSGPTRGSALRVTAAALATRAATSYLSNMLSSRLKSPPQA